MNSHKLSNDSYSNNRSVRTGHYLSILYLQQGVFLNKVNFLLMWNDSSIQWVCQKS